MFEPVFDNLRKATEASIQLQQDMFQKWMSMYPTPMAGLSTAGLPNFVEEARKMQKKWEDHVTELLKKQRETVDAHYQAGLKSLEELFQVGQAKSPQEVQERVMELYRHNFESLRQLSESQIKDFKAAADRWTQLMTKSA